jgi:hypothetical protein
MDKEDWPPLTKEFFEPGSPYSCWLREQLYGEGTNGSFGGKTHGLFKKHNVQNYSDDNLREITMNFRGLDGLPEDLRKVAVDIIKLELDENFYL